MSLIKHKLTQFLLILICAFLFFKFGIPALSYYFTGTAAPVPAHLLWAIYMPAITLVSLLFVSSSEASWNEFRTPVVNLLVNRESIGVVLLRLAILILLPILAGVITFFQLQSTVSAPASLRSIHPADPGTITVDNEQFVLQGLSNPYRHEGQVDRDILDEGHQIYIQNCMFCHGDGLDGNGMFADGLNPRPANFTDPGTIAQLSESYVLWRVAKGGPGLPVEGKPWNSAMPAWEDQLTVDEMWKVIAYLYEGAGPNIFPAERSTTGE